MAHGRNILIALVASISILVIELYASWKTGSLALLSDAGHVLTDASGLVVAYFALVLASRPATKRASFGFQRAEVLAAATNGFLVVGVAVFLVVQSVERLLNPVAQLDSQLVLIVGLAGLAINVAVAYLLASGAGENINVEGARLNVMGDAFASIGVIVSALLVWWTGNVIWDTLVSFLVAAIIVRAAWSLLKSSASILLETVPPHLDLSEIKAAVETIPDVVNVYDLHVWTLTPGNHSLSMHVSVKTPADFYDTTKQMEDVLANKFGLEHCTIQVMPSNKERDQFDPIGSMK